MCTAITLQSQQMENFFGRSMDFSYHIEPQLFIIPQNYTWSSVLNSQQFLDLYSFMAIGEENSGMLGFFDGVNEKGFAAAALYFAGYAQYNDQKAYNDKIPVASVDFLHFILGRCNSIRDLINILPNLSIVGYPDPVTRTVAPLHWIATDRSGECVVIEHTENGLQVFQNQIGVMVNSPDFQWHMTNLRNYMEVSPHQTGEAVWGNVELKPFGQAGGTVPLPGGYTSPERFVRTAFQKTHILSPKDGMEALLSCFHIIDSVTIPKGVVITGRSTYDYTKYVAFINTKTCEYFFKTYDNIQIRTARLWDNYKYLSKPICLGNIMRPMIFEPVISE